MNVYAMSGIIGSGKSTLSKIFAQANDMIYVSTGDYLREIALKKGYDIYNRRNLDIVFNEIIKNGWIFFCDSLFGGLKSSEKDIVVDSIKGKESYLALMSFFNNVDVYLIYCHIDEKISVLRQIKRGDKNIYEYCTDLIDFNGLNYLKNEADIVLDTSCNITETFNELQIWYERRKCNGRI